jgi:hypothetical protein
MFDVWDTVRTNKLVVDCSVCRPLQDKTSLLTSVPGYINIAGLERGNYRLRLKREELETLIR